jgi:tetratricopeptide (TPR) repeat protein
MASSDAPPPVVSASPPRPLRRRWVWLVAAGVLVVAGVLPARESWALWHERAARRALDADHKDEAHSQVHLALRVRGTRSSTLLLASRIARLQGAYAEAAQLLDRCGRHNGMSEPLELEWMLLRCQRGEIDELAPSLLALVKAGHAESATILEALSAVYLQKTRYGEALDCLNLWLERDPDSIRALNWRGWVSAQLDHRMQALTDYERLLELQPDRSDVRLRLAEILVDSTRHAEAVPHLERLRAELPDNPDVAVALARCFRVQLRKDEARELLDGVLREHPEHVAALLTRGQLELDAGRFRDAETWFRKALESSPQDSEARYILYQSLRGQPGRQHEAEQELARWKQDKFTQDRLTRLLRTELGKYPNDPDLARETGELLLVRGEGERGLYWLHRALALNPHHVPTLKALVAWYERTKDTTRAAEYRQRLAAAQAAQ